MPSNISITGRTMEDPDDYLDKLSHAFTIASDSFQFQDISRCEESVQIAKTLYKKAGEFDQPFVRVEAEVYLLGCRLFLNILQYSQLSVQGKLEKAEERFNECQEICREGTSILASIDEEMGVGENFRTVFGYTFRIFDLFLTGLDFILESEIGKKTGKIVRESEAFYSACQAMRKVSELDYVDIPFIISFRAMIRRYVELYENRADLLRKEEEIIRYITPNDRKVFIIHGHDEGSLRNLEDMLTDTFNLEVAVLKDQANQGESVIAKFEETGRNCGYAIALLTPDDVVRNKNSRYMQARANVLFELGWFCGRFGRSRVCIIKKKDTEIPSDLGGVICLDYYENVEELRTKLEKELIIAGILDKKE